MKTYKELISFCEKNNVRYEVNAKYSEPYEYLKYENGKMVWKSERVLLGYEFGMNNIAGRKGKSEWQWVWYETIAFHRLEDDTKFYFKERYSQLNGKSYTSWRESAAAREIIAKRMK